MGQLLELWEDECSRMYWPLMSPSTPRTPEILAKFANLSVDLADLQHLLEQGWREQIVGGVASLFHPEPKACLPLVWRAFDSGSWASPQLGVCAMLLDPEDPSEAHRRLLMRCPVYSQHLEGTDPMWRHVVHGSAAIDSHSTKAMAALIETLSRDPQGREWLTSHLAFEDAFWALEADFWDQGENISRSFSNPMGPMLAAVNKNVPAWLHSESPKELLELWDIQAQPAAVRSLCFGTWETRIARFFEPFAQAGHLSLLMEGDAQQLRLSSRTPVGNQVLLKLRGPYYEALWSRLEFDTRHTNVFPLYCSGQEVAALRVEQVAQGLSIFCLREYEPPSDFQLTDRPLEECPAQIWVIGIDERARFDGGVAAMVAEWGGEDLIDSIRYGLAQCERQPGRALLATSEQLKQKGIREVACLITIPQPTVAQLCAGLEAVLEYARRKYSRLALPALGCGAGGLTAREVAGPLLGVLGRYRHYFQTTLSLPRESDRKAFQAAMDR